MTVASFDTTEEALENLSAELGVKGLPQFRFYQVGEGGGVFVIDVCVAAELRVKRLPQFRFYKVGGNGECWGGCCGCVGGTGEGMQGAQLPFIPCLPRLDSAGRQGGAAHDHGGYKRTPLTNPSLVPQSHHTTAYIAKHDCRMARRCWTRSWGTSWRRWPRPSRSWRGSEGVIDAEASSLQVNSGEHQDTMAAP